MKHSRFVHAEPRILAQNSAGAAGESGAAPAAMALAKVRPRKQSVNAVTSAPIGPIPATRILFSGRIAWRGVEGPAGPGPAGAGTARIGAAGVGWRAGLISVLAWLGRAG
jgi:hypothetical protein